MAKQKKWPLPESYCLVLLADDLARVNDKKRGLVGDPCVYQMDNAVVVDAALQCFEGTRKDDLHREFGRETRDYSRSPT
jgi:hypothetical protein